jgi:hypothetical protein
LTGRECAGSKNKKHCGQVGVLMAGWNSMPGLDCVPQMNTLVISWEKGNRRKGNRFMTYTSIYLADKRFKDVIRSDKAI